MCQICLPQFSVYLQCTSDINVKVLLRNGALYTSMEGNECFAKNRRFGFYTFFCLRQHVCGVCDEFGVCFGHCKVQPTSFVICLALSCLTVLASGTITDVKSNILNQMTHQRLINLVVLTAIGPLQYRPCKRHTEWQTLNQNPKPPLMSVSLA